MKQRLSLFLATGCYLGLIPGAPGTYAGLATTLVFYLCYLISHKILLELHLSALGVVVMLGTLAASEVAQDRGLEDPQIVVIDEVAGQLLTISSSEPPCFECSTSGSRFPYASWSISRMASASCWTICWRALTQICACTL